MRRSKGSVLLGALMMVSILLMILVGVDTSVQGGGGLMQMVSSEHLWVHRDYANTTAINLAEAGLDQSLDDIAKNWSNGTSYNKTENFSAGSYTAKTIASTSDAYTLESTGTVTQYGVTVSRKVRLTVNKGTGNDTPHAILANGNVNLKRASAAIYASPTIAIHTNGNFLYQGSVGLYAQGGASYAGVTASGNIVANGSLAASEQKARVESEALPSVDFNNLKTDAQTNGSYKNVNWDVWGVTIGCEGVTYVKGNLTLHGDVKVKGTLVVEGNVSIDGTLKPYDSTKNLELITKGNVDFKDRGASSSGPELIANVYCEGNFKMSPGSPWIKGSVVATGNMEFTADNAGSFRLDYVASPANSKLSQGSGVTPSDWKEVY